MNTNQEITKNVINQLIEASDRLQTLLDEGLDPELNDVTQEQAAVLYDAALNFQDVAGRSIAALSEVQ